MILLKNMFNNQIFNFSFKKNKNHTNYSKKISYNGFLLNNWPEIIWNIKFLWSKKIWFDSSFFDNNFWKIYSLKEMEKVIEVTWTIKKWSREELIYFLDYLKLKLLEPNKDLIIEYWWVKRKVNAVCNGINFSENHYNIYWVNYEISFVTYDYFEDLDAISDIFLTSENKVWNIERVWTFDSYLDIIINFKKSSSVNEIIFLIEEQKITINNQINSWDIVHIDGRNQEVKINNNSISFFWEIPRLKKENNTSKLKINWSFEIEVLYKYYPTYK